MDIEKLFSSKAFLLIYRHWRWGVLLVLACCTGAILQHFLLPSYKASSRLHVRTAEESPLLRSIGKISGLVNTYPFIDHGDKYVKLLLAQNYNEYLKTKIQERMNKGEKLADISRNIGIVDSNFESAQDLADYLIGRTSFNSKEDIVSVITWANNSNEAVNLSKYMVRQSQKYLVDYESKEIEEAQKYLRRKLKDTQANIEKVNSEIDKIRESQDVVNISDGGSRSLASENYAKLTEEEWTNEVRLRELNHLIAKVSRQIESRNTAASIAEARGRMVDSLRDLKDEKEVRLTRLAGIRDQLKKIAKLIKPKFEQTIYDLKRKLDQMHSLYAQVQTQLFEIQMHQISVENQIRPYSVATSSSAGREFPLIYKLMIVMLLSMALIFIMAVAWEKMHPVVYDKNQLRNIGMSFLGSVPNLLTYSMRANNVLMGIQAGNKRSLVHDPRIRNRVTTIFQFLGAKTLQNLLRIRGRRSGVISIVSYKAGEGKTLLTANMAAVLGSYGLNVLVIDTDCFRIHKSTYLADPTGEGLIDWIQDQSKKLSKMFRKSHFANVWFLPSGMARTNLDLYKEDKFTQLITECRKEFDIILLDTPAFEVGAEAVYYCDQSDMTIVVSKAYQTPVENLIEIVDTLALRGRTETFGIINCQESNTNFPDTYYGTPSSTDGAPNAA